MLNKSPQIMIELRGPCYDNGGLLFGHMGLTSLDVNNLRFVIKKQPEILQIVDHNPCCYMK
jgi:hypothetical protein